MGFNPRSPRGGATIKFVKSSIVLILFQSTLPTRGSDFNFRSFFKPDYGFNPRSPRGGATVLIAQGIKAVRVSIHAPHEGERPYHSGLYGFSAAVSIHAPHEGERRFRYLMFACYLPVSIHAPHEGERRLYTSYQLSAYRSFQSTLPTRGSDWIAGFYFFAPRPVSIHAPHEGERLEDIQRLRTEDMFQSTLPTRGSDISDTQKAHF